MSIPSPNAGLAETGCRSLSESAGLRPHLPDGEMVRFLRSIAARNPGFRLADGPGEVRDSAADAVVALR
jgi:hypothetical protein